MMRIFTFGECSILAGRNGAIQEIPDRIGKYRGCIETIILKYTGSKNVSFLRVPEDLNNDQKNCQNTVSNAHVPSAISGRGMLSLL
jgi:hypothetical protein